MPLSPGVRLGPYEILSPLGAGGMGEVWKAKDTRLDRFVAVKVLPEHLAKNPEALARFEREAKAVAALNHPNITGIFDIGQVDDMAYAVMELLEGESLRTRLEKGPIPPRKATELAIQMAQGLAAAHEKGIVHRDLKPENLWITHEGRLKILDFGLAKQLPGMGTGSDSFVPTAAISPGPHTEQGMILGTVGYMSPEQVKGEPVDARADIFSFGVVLYEMLIGQRAFARDTAAETMAAILKEEPPEDGLSGRTVSPGLQRVITHCLEKAPAQRFQGAADLAFALGALDTGSVSAASTQGFTPRTWRSQAKTGLILLLLGVIAYLLAGHRPKVAPTFKRLTFGKGMVDNARFVPGSGDIMYSARWNGNAPEVFSLPPDSIEPRNLGIQGAALLAVSPSGELAVKTGPRLWGGFEAGTLTRVTPGGGRRELRPAVVEAEWMPGGTQLSLIHLGPSDLQRGGTSDTTRYTNMENSTGSPALGSGLFVWALRASPKGDRIAYFDQPNWSRGDGRLMLADQQGKQTPLLEMKGFTGLAWGPGGDEIWFSEFKGGNSSIWAITPSGHKRLLMRQAGLLELMDVAQDGRILASLGIILKGTMGVNTPDFREKDVSWNEAVYTHDISPNGKYMLIGSGDAWASENAHTPMYLRSSDGSIPSLLCEGIYGYFMPNGRQVITVSGNRDSKINLVPLDAGQAQERSFPGLNTHIAMPLGDTQRVLITQNEFWFVLDLRDASRKPLAEEQLVNALGCHPVSPNGDWVMLRKNEGNLLDPPLYLFSTKGMAPRLVKGYETGDWPLRWNAEGTSIYVFNRDGFPTRIHRIDIATGKRTLVREITPANPSGLPGIRSLALSPDSNYLAYNYVRKLSDLYLIEGLK